jgi:uncharacterized protein (DUF983 family)
MEASALGADPGTEIGGGGMYRGTYSSPFSSASRHRRRFHRLGIIAAAIAMVTGTAIIVAAVVRLELWEALKIVVDFTVIALAVVCLAVYLMVRAVGWVLAGFMTRCDIHPIAMTRGDTRANTTNCLEAASGRDSRGRFFSPRL